MKINELLTRLETVTYPTTTDRVVEEFDDPKLTLVDGEERLSTVFDRINNEVLDCCDDAKLAVLGGLKGDAVGRKGYSDRDPPTPSESDSVGPTL
ncbi:hypothetical protein AArcSl_1845 [Halalkaliarchaeum desulfuricum]|uniref:DUF2795 domain-containing protein n=1 Tax=Halalkaliarchaeum desulfuricum TaxID=2055893 RepID=A0A343TK49_9EURY|nr:DUF2795 domain-containing protein [Halalkaliarchaeum desulfuricum]AUX09471.1 hypothetical protein AArcSl_1845 [Halalkaliarchaeum desulfuricum]